MPGHSGYAYDNLNRMTDSPGYEYENDIMGNRLERAAPSNPPVYPVPSSYGWDLAGRMTSFSPGMGSCSYWYRADGMRIQKVVDPGTVREDDDSGFWDENLAVNKPTTRYYHDGQSVYEEDFTRYEGGTAIKTDVLRYALGARGVEMIAWLPDGGEWGYKYPLYDLHGNMVATMHRGTGGAYTLGDVKLYDAWGAVRSGSGGPTQRYCASLGHVQDDESSLIYMRARYYEPTTGRFISEDPKSDGLNWYSYCANDPISSVDGTGNKWVAVLQGMEFLIAMALCMSATFAERASNYPVAWACLLGGLTILSYAVCWGPRTSDSWKGALQSLSMINLAVSILVAGKVLTTDARTVWLAGYIMAYELAILACIVDCYILPGQDIWNDN